MEKLLGASWKTSLAGIGLILGGLGTAIGQFASGGWAAVDLKILLGAVVAGLGLIVAKDAGVSNAPSPGLAARVQ